MQKLTCEGPMTKFDTKSGVFESELIEGTILVSLKSQALKILIDQATSSDYFNMLNSVNDEKDIRAYVQINDAESYGLEAVDDLVRILSEGDDQLDKPNWSVSSQKELLAARFKNTVGRILLARATLNKVKIAGLEGMISGEYLGSALYFDMRIATADVTFCFDNLRTGIPASPGLTFLMPRFIGLGRTLDLINSCATIDARDALELGLVSEIVENREKLNERCIQEAQRLSDHHANSVTYNRDQMMPSASEMRSTLESYYKAASRFYYAHLQEP